MICGLLCLLAQGGEFSGHVKSMSALALAPEWLVVNPALAQGLGLQPEQLLSLAGVPSGAQPYSLIDLRMRYALSLGESLTLEVQPALWLQTGAGFSTGQAAPARSELIQLSYRPSLDGPLRGELFLDRLRLTAQLGSTSLTVGRQSVGFGVGQIFTPMDLVGPFGPTSVDTEYKRGVDALRLDKYLGTSTQLSVVAAWDGPPPNAPEAIDTPAVFTFFARGTLGAVDLHALAGSVHGDWVGGAGLSGGLGPVALYAEGTVSASERDGRFVRAVMGSSWMSGGPLSLSAELYYQSIGADRPDQLLSWMSNERVLRGELWQVGHTYAALAGGVEFSPLVNLSGAFLMNLADSSVLLSPSFSWSASENVSVLAGGFLPLAAGPSPVNLEMDLSSGVPSLQPPSQSVLARSVKSEFGQYPRVIWLQFRAYY